MNTHCMRIIRLIWAYFMVLYCGSRWCSNAPLTNFQYFYDNTVPYTLATPTHSFTTFYAQIWAYFMVLHCGSRWCANAPLNNFQDFL